MCSHLTWKVKHTKKGVYRICRGRGCKMKILMAPSGAVGFYDLFPEKKNIRPKGLHKKTWKKQK